MNKPDHVRQFERWWAKEGQPSEGDWLKEWCEEAFYRGYESGRGAGLFYASVSPWEKQE